MESRPAAHEKLTPDEIKESISNIEDCLNELKETFLELHEIAEDNLLLLKKHFCPERFTEVTMTMKELTEIFGKHYSTPTGETLIFKRYEENDGVAEAE